ncbi:hypothetical protein FB567DRAFT_24701 [Paraphoma chrysanthemicola]|uniref:Prion-inhibition and propagation HeLo domain-containing protein n=1 Tax=Paraphoma chrysanthemicola TaxID=798071 RepID=A0A8K0RKY5_9PLEO|nr:hypothetical protein FB567DRAFT_24701 [Paraphoma chrysanthemicola]
MAEVIGILAALFTAGEALESFAHQTRKWKRLSDRLYDIHEGLAVAELALASWKRKYRIEERPIKYMQVLFGKEGTNRITATLGSISVASRKVRQDINKIVGRALQARLSKGPFDDTETDFDERLLEDCLRRIKGNTTWSHKFVLSALGKADELERRIERLDKKVGVLERFSDYFLEREHPEIFAEIKRLPGRRVVLKVGDGGTDDLGKHLRNAMAARQDAQLLHRVSGQGNRVHIGLSVPQIPERDFDFLLNLEGRTHEIVAHPVKIRAVNNSSRVKSDFKAVVPALRSNPGDDLYVLPSAASSDGFHVSVPRSHHLVDLEHKDSLATTIKNKDTYLGSQILYPQDQSAIASGIAQGSLRLIGSQWLNFLDCSNVRWRRGQDGNWTSMLTAAPGSKSTTKTLDQCLEANRAGRGSRDLTKHVQIFRIGLVVAELALKTPISYVDFDPSSNTVKLFVNDGEEKDPTDLAEDVERESNKFLGNIVFYCLNVLQDKDRMKDKEIEGDYFREVMKDVKHLNGLLQPEKRRGDKSPVSAGSGMAR